MAQKPVTKATDVPVPEPDPAEVRRKNVERVGVAADVLDEVEAGLVQVALDASRLYLVVHRIRHELCEAIGKEPPEWPAPPLIEKIAAAAAGTEE